jgi:glutamyl-tRNA reductase
VSSSNHGRLEATPPAAATSPDRLMVASSTWREANTAAREETAPLVHEMAGHLSERVLLRTCHRVELIGVLERKQPSGERGVGGFRLFTGPSAAERVLLVAGGLDSAVIAEDEILGQVRRTYQAALERGETGPILNELFRRAIRFGKRVRSEASPASEHSLVDRAVRWFENRSRPSDTPPTALVFGTGQVGRAMAVRLAEMGVEVTVASRAMHRATQVAQGLPPPGRHHSALVGDVLGGEVNGDLVVLATNGSSVRLDARHLAGPGRVHVIDLCSPAAVAPDARHLLGDRLLDLDRLGILTGIRRLAPRAEARLRDEARAEAARFVVWLDQRSSGDAVALLRLHAAQVRQRHLERLRRGDVLEPRQLVAVEAMTEALVGELLHTPTVRLREDALSEANVRRLFGIEA